MKTTLLITILLILCSTIYAQKKMTDSEFEGYKGQIKSVLTEYVEAENPKGKVKKQQRIKESIYLFEKNGGLSQIIYPDTEKLIFKLIDGYLTYKSYDINKSKEVDRISVPMKVEKPIEEPEKLVSPDKRFDAKFIYEYDSQGRVKLQKEYENNGHLSTKTEYKYDGEGQLIKETTYDSDSISEISYKYDNKGNLIETVANKDIKSPRVDNNDKTVYSDYIYDNQGNWIERKSTWFYEENGRQFKNISIYYRTIVYY